MKIVRRMAGYFLLGFAFAAPAATPPAEWATHIELLRQADTVKGDEARCLAHPDLPGNEWSKDAAKWRCSLLRAPAWSLDEIEALLASDDGVAELGRRFAGLLDAHYRDQQQREQIFRTLAAFDTSERAGRVATRWAEMAPDSAFAQAALGTHHLERAWEARGEKFVSKISREHLDMMTQEFQKAVPLLAKALELESRLSPACIGLARVGRQSSDELEAWALGTCARIDPDSYYFAYELVFGSQPRWGGSPEALRNAVAYVAARVERNPILGALLAEHVGDAPSLVDKPSEVIDELLLAARMAPSGTLIAVAGKGLQNNNDHWGAIAYLSQALRFWPEDDSYRSNRSKSLVAVGELEWALHDAEIAMRLDPENAWYVYRAGWIIRKLHGPAAARPYFKQAMAQPTTRAIALDQYCQTFLLEGLDEESGRCTAEFVAEFPNSGEAWRQRMHALYRLGQQQEALAAIANFVRLADPKDRIHQQELPIAAKLKQELETASVPASSHTRESGKGLENIGNSH